MAPVVALLGTLGIPGLGAAHAQQASPPPALDAENRERLRTTIRRLLDAAQVASISKPITATAVTQLVTQLVEQLRDGTLRGWAAAQGTAETTDYWLSSHAEPTRAPATATAGNR
jgi:hypothetical protein